MWPADGPPAPDPPPLGAYLAVTSSLAASVIIAAALFPGLLSTTVSCRAVELALALLAAALGWVVLSMLGEEGRLNSRGETLLPRWRRMDREGALGDTDMALREAILDLRGGAEVRAVVGRLERGTHHGDGLGEGRAGRCYRVALGMLREEWAGVRGRLDVKII